MIKLVASDLDGTLLQNGSQELKEEVFTYVRELTKRGIIFVAASGRQYDNMRRLFEPVQDEIYYICENGAISFYKDKVIQKCVMDRELGQEMLHAIWDREGAEILLSGEHTSYLQPKEESYYHRMKNIVKNNVTVVEDIFAVPEEYMKISVYDKNGIKESAGYWSERFGERANVVTSGNEWLDMMPFGVHKGRALQKIMNMCHVSSQEAMAFGDQHNDIEMLLEVKYGYAMDNAQEKVKQACDYHTASVENTLREMLKKLEKEK